MVGKKYSRLTALKNSGVNKNGRILWECLCDCGNTTIVDGISIRNGAIKSCGCLVSDKIKERNTTHGLSKTPEYKIWKDIRKRVNNINHKNYNLYGGRGIKISPNWDDFTVFLADMGKRPSLKHSIDRINNDGDYCKENCRWATQLEQCHNKNNYSRNKTGQAGVSLYRGKKYLVRITANYKENHIGYFDTLEEAIKAREEAELKYW